MKTLVHTDKELIEEIIRKCEICYAGLADTDGTPYVLPMNFGYREGVISTFRSGREKYLYFGTESTGMYNLQYRP